MSKKKEEEQNNLIAVAVRFLNSDQVATATEQDKINFLKKKGLNEESIKKAFEQAKLKKEEQLKALTKTTQQVTEVVLSDKSKQIENQIKMSQTTQILDIKNMNISQLSAELLENNNIHSLVLSYNPLQNIPSKLSEFQNLKVLHIHRCGLFDNQILNIYQIPSLTHLIASYNNISYIDDISKLTKLQVADFSHNSIFELPNDIKYLPLIYLDVSFNNILIINDEVKKGMIKTLKYSNNPISLQ